MMPNAQTDGSGTVMMSKLQLTSWLWAPTDKSARNNVHPPFGFVPLNELSSADGAVEPNNDGAEYNGSMFRPSGTHVPVNCPLPFVV